MAKTFQTNSMNIHEGMTPGVNEYGQVGNLAWTPRIAAKTAAYTVKSSESGTIFTNVGATDSVTFTLPSIADGPFYYMFVAGADYAIVVASAVADTAITFNDAAADSVSFGTSSEILGGSIEVFCDGTSLFVLPRLASEAQTITIVTA